MEMQNEDFVNMKENLIDRSLQEEHPLGGLT